MTTIFELLMGAAAGILIAGCSYRIGFVTGKACARKKLEPPKERE